MAKQLLSFQILIEVNVQAGTKNANWCDGRANDTVLTNYVAGVNCTGMPRALTQQELDGTLGDFLAAHQTELEGNM